MNAGNLVDMRRGIHDVASHPERFCGIRDRETQITSIFLFVPSTYPLSLNVKWPQNRKTQRKKEKQRACMMIYPVGK